MVTGVLHIDPESNDLVSLTVDHHWLIGTGFGGHLDSGHAGGMQLANQFWSVVSRSVRAFCRYPLPPPNTETSVFS